jgi:hypothetical protein
MDTNISEKHAVFIFRAEVGCWEVESLYKFIKMARLVKN